MYGAERFDACQCGSTAPTLTQALFGEDAISVHADWPTVVQSPS